MSAGRPHARPLPYHPWANVAYASASCAAEWVRPRRRSRRPAPGAWPDAAGAGAPHAARAFLAMRPTSRGTGCRGGRRREVRPHPLRRIHPDDGSASLHSGPSGLPVKSFLFPLGTLMPSAREGPPQPSGRRTSGGGRRPSHLPFPSEGLGRAFGHDPANTLRVQGNRHPNLRRRYKLYGAGQRRAPLRHLQLGGQSSMPIDSLGPSRRH